MFVLKAIVVLVLFVMSAGFQLFIFAALYQSDGSMLLIDPHSEIRLIEFVLASAIFTVAILALYSFIRMVFRREPFD